MARAFLLIIDGLGVGAQEDAANYSDEHADTLGNVSKITGVNLPNLERLGLGNIRPFHSIAPAESPLASFGKMREVSAGKDSTTGHWEIAGIHLKTPFPTYPNGFPEEVIQPFCKGTGVKGVLCNLPYSGTKVIEDFGDEHMETGLPIVYTSADSVYQVACHVDMVSLDVLYKWCNFARKDVLTGVHSVGRVIARPFKGRSGAYERVSEKRQDFSLQPPEPNMLSFLQNIDVKTYSIGKIIDLFANTGFTQYRKTKSNAEGISQLLSLMSAGIDHSFTFVNLIDTDQVYGHRQDPAGYARCLEEVDLAIPAIYDKLKDDDLMLITGDHGNDPADDSTDHTREFVPLLIIKKGSEPGVNLGTRKTFADAAATILDFFGISGVIEAESCLNEISKKRNAAN